MGLKVFFASAGVTALAALVACATPGEQAAAPEAAASAPAGSKIVPVAYRRLTESQYRNAIRDVFGPAIAVAARFEPERREEGLQAVGAARLSITPSGLEQYYAAARSIADQVIEGKDRAALGCDAAAADAACAEIFIRHKGEQLFRRPVTAAEQAQFSATWRGAMAATDNDFNKALKQTLVGMLMSPEFLFRVERAETTANGQRLDGYTKAARISFLLWNAGPDAELMRAAGSGELHTDQGLARQVDRLLASPRVEDGVRAFFSDMLEFEAFDTLTKDAATYPKFSQAVADSAREETLRFLVNHLVKKNGDYREIFTSRETEIDRTLAYVYSVPYLSAEPWSPYTFPAESERSGLLTQTTFSALFSHPAASSPTLRGLKLQDIFRCIEVPQPPPDVDFSKVQALEHGTVRVRLLEHMTNPGCVGCHSITDPIGLTLERFDALGQHRTVENGSPIDVAAQIDQKNFVGAQGLGQYLHGDSRIPTCLVRKVYLYGVGRPREAEDSPDLARQTAAFISGGYRLPALFRSILTDPRFYRVAVPKAEGPEVRTAQFSLPNHPVVGDVR